MDAKEEKKQEELNIAKQISEATEIAFSFDTTGSMNPCIAAVREQIEKTCEELFEEIPGLKVGFIAHGDYCDGENCYQILPLTDDRAKIFDFIRNAPNTSGGDSDECYELVLNQAKELGWSKANGKVLVVIGDAHPHEVGYPQNTGKLDWRAELADLKEMGINVYGLQCLYSEHGQRNNSFWSAMAEIADTPLMKLQSLRDSETVLKGFAYAASGPENFAKYEAKVALMDTADFACAENVEALNTVLRRESFTKFAKGPTPPSGTTDATGPKD